VSDPQFVILIGALVLIASACGDSDSDIVVAYFFTALSLCLGGLVWWLI
jgi:hypothetical protein